MKIAFVDSEKSPVNNLRTMDWSELSAMLSAPEISASKAGAAWLPADIEPGARTGERVNSVSLLVLDVEADTASDPLTKIKTVIGEEPPPFDEIALELAMAGLCSILHTSHSHNDPAIMPAGVKHSRYRIVFALSRPLEKNEVRPLALHVAALFGLSDCVDTSCMEAARLYFMPRCPADRLADFQHISVEGDPLDVDVLLNNAHLETEALTYAKTQQKQRDSSKRNKVIEAFNEAHSISEILPAHGYIPQRARQGIVQRWTHPTSTTGMPAVRLLPEAEIERIFSSHGNDPLNDGHAHDAFDCFCILKHGGDFKTAVREAAHLLGMNTRPATTNMGFGATPPAGALPAPPPPAAAPSRSWPTLASPFEKHVVPAFPIHVLSAAIQDFCIKKSAQSGFDIGGYAFSILVAAGCAVDHRIKMDVGAFKVPAYLWGALSGDSGAGKSPTLTAATQAGRDIDSETIRQSRLKFTNWLQQVEIAKKFKTDESIAKPQWKQRIAMDATTEALAALLADNPEGVNLFIDELTEFIGRMDAYSGADGKDRGVYLRAYDGGQVTINRASKHALVVDNFSVGILTGIQPEKLAQLFKKSGGGSDGLYQRFLIYCMRPAGQVDYSAPLGMLTELNLSRIFQTLNTWAASGTITNAVLDNEGRGLMQDYHNSIRQLTCRTAAKRFAEHLDKYAGIVGRVCFALHCIECANAGHYIATVTAKTMLHAIEVMRVMYRHSEATYAVLDSESGDVLRLVVSACEAILTKRWACFMRGDLTRNATHWQGADIGMAEGAIDYLIELGWIADITAAPVAGKRGRRSDGAFLVNPSVHEQFKEHATRVTQSRADRYQALKNIAGQ